MKKISSLSAAILILALASRIAICQEQPEFEKVYFQDNDGNIYWNVKLPVYIQISATSDYKSPVTLKNVMREDMKKFANPLYWDGPGIHWIRHYDYDSPIPEQEIAYQIIVDGNSPVTSLKFNSAPKYVDGNKTFFGKGLEATLTAEDDYSGVKSIYQSINGAKFNEYSAIQNFNEEKEFVYKYFSVDKTGNPEPTKDVSFTVDLTSPTTSHSVETNFIETILSPRSVISLQSTDNLAGVNNITYGFDSTKGSIYSSPVKLNNLTDGEHKLIYYATDNVKNKEDNKEFAFYLDKTPPVVTSSLDGGIYTKNNITYIAETTKIILNATDNKAGVSEIQYIIDGGKKETYTQPFALSINGNHVIQTRGIDKVQNEGSFQTEDIDLNINLHVDNTAPSVSNDYTGLKVFRRDTSFITSKTSIKLNAIDNESGVANTEYTLDNGPLTEYTGPFTVNSEGSHKIHYTVTDNVGISKSTDVFFIVDNTGPEIFYHMSLEQIGSQKLVGKSTETPIYAINTNLYLAATDKLVGTKSIYYSLNNTGEKLYSAFIKLNTRGAYSLKIRAVDELGNETKSDAYDFVIQ